MKQKMLYQGSSVLEVIVSTILITTTFLLFAGLVSKVLFTRADADQIKILMQEDSARDLTGYKTDSNYVIINGVVYQKISVSNKEQKTLHEHYILSPGKNLYYTPSAKKQ